MTTDLRHIETGLQIPSEGYCDQPYVVVNGDGSWTVVMTTGTGHEGAAGQHVVSARSGDQGKTWEGLFDIEPADGPEASWVMPLIVPENCGAIRVGSEARPWVEGELLIFDDSMLHEAWNDSDSERVVLLFDIWRPELTPEERALVTTVLEAARH